MLLIILGVIIALILGGFAFYKREEGEPYGGLLTTAVAVLVASILVGSTIHKLNSTEVAVVKLFTGRVQRKPVTQPGFFFTLPGSRVYRYPIRLQEYTMASKNKEKAIRLLTKDGLNVSADLTVWYRIVPDSVVRIYLTVGDMAKLKTAILKPSIRSAARDIAARFTAMDLIADSNRTLFAKWMQAYLDTLLTPRGVIVEQVLLRNVQLPKQVTNAIERKLVAQQKAEQMKFELQQAKLEAQKRIAEAEGIAKANQLIAQSLTQGYVQYEYVKALQQFAQGQNNTIIVLPAEMKGIMPLVNIPTR